ncbi:aminodeoxychorismate synthase component I [Gordonia sp. (in: high G+C Gram-positive bacteria)]|uniref:aminodeoxychorismate synthase component I n=1 Tax=Gordonia sp. (in: high G+C Gram-positive bacteria) TaxID=84139 RepID=UPI001DBCCD39|nr:aminodeoxychorismate synthase component I [Gordonia sp. (in: high G+C Gram-positive bacteria)]MCB1296442.1 aminodeoxychorismate synthase component I [Gordonia sp. (in: high G+C Gram-positive bacteria)]HMS77117.1 aminodeoxychorismate synthase component I [Gordonia sp. (in: high G+C Gram-positive bacteria)]
MLGSLIEHTGARGLPPPAALVGDWWGADAVIAPSIDIVAGHRPPPVATRFWFGYIGFPAYPATGGDGLPEVAGGETSGILISRAGRWEYLSVDGSPCPAWVSDCLAAAGQVHLPDPPRVRWTAPERGPHLAAVKSCLEAIRAGEVYQACVCTRFTGRIDGPPSAFYRLLAATTTPAKSAFLQGDWGCVASFSPETFLRRTGGVVTSAPIKGTVPAGADPATLASSEKDIAENVMIVDLVRNDLGRVADVGSVTVPALLRIQPAPGVWHLVSTVAATVGDDVTTTDLLEATFPPASVTGTPKLRALSLLAGWEQHSRGLYCGAIGMAGPGGDLDLNVAIRTVAVTPDGSAVLGVGGGITIDSDPYREWQECLDKASTIISAFTRDDTGSSHRNR